MIIFMFVQKQNVKIKLFSLINAMNQHWFLAVHTQKINNKETKSNKYLSQKKYVYKIHTTRLVGIFYLMCKKKMD